jgi:hypothetical protein
MPNLLETLGAIGPAVGQAGQTYRQFGQELAAERRAGTESALKLEDLQLRREAALREERQVKIAEDTARLAADKAAREEAEYQRGNLLIDPKDYFPRLGLGPNASAAMMEGLTKNIAMEPLEGGALGIRQRNVQAAHEKFSKDPLWQKEVSVGKIKDIEADMTAIAQQLIKKGPNAQLEEQYDMLAAQKTQLNTEISHWNKILEKAEAIPSTEAARIRVEGAAAPVTAEKQAQELAKIEAKGEEERKTELVKQAGRMELAVETTKRIKEAIAIKAKSTPANVDIVGITEDLTQFAVTDKKDPSGKIWIVTPEEGKTITDKHIKLLPSHKVTELEKQPKKFTLAPTYAAKATVERTEQAMERLNRILEGTK